MQKFKVVDLANDPVRVSAIYSAWGKIPDYWRKLILPVAKRAVLIEQPKLRSAIAASTTRWTYHRLLDTVPELARRRRKEIVFIAQSNGITEVVCTKATFHDADDAELRKQLIRAFGAVAYISSEELRTAVVSVTHLEKDSGNAELVFVDMFCKWFSRCGAQGRDEDPEMEHFQRISRWALSAAEGR